MKTLRVIGAMLALIGLLALAPTTALAEGGHTVFGDQYVLKTGQTLPDDLTVFGGKATLEADSIVEGNVVLLGGEAVIAGRVNGDLAAMGGSVRIEGTAIIEGDVTIFGQAEISSEAQIKGELVKGSDVGGRLRELPEGIQDRATPALPEVETAPAAPEQPQQPPRMVKRAARVGGSLAGLVVVLFVAVMIANFAPDNLERVTHQMTTTPALSVGIGLLTLVVTAILTPILIAICIGLPVAIVLGLALVLAALLGWVAAGRLAGQKLAPIFKIKLATPLRETLVGTLGLSLVAMLPGLGALLGFVVVCWGVGAAVLTRFGAMPGSTPFGGPVPAHRAPTTQPPAAPEPPAPRSKDTKPLDPSLARNDE